MKFTTIPDMFYKTCESFGSNKPAFLYKQNGKIVGINYSELQECVECFALSLLSLGIRAGDRLGIVSENRIEWAIADYAITCLGALDVPIFPTLSSKQEEYIFNDCQVSAVIVSNKFQYLKVAEFKERLHSLRHIVVIDKDFETGDLAVKSMSDLIEQGREIKPEEERRKIIKELAAKINSDDLLTLIYTSGTTGNPKGVMLSHNNIISNIIAAEATVQPNSQDRFLSYLPWCHSYERTTGYYLAFSIGATVAIAESLESVVANIKEMKPTFLTTVPRLLEIIAKRISKAMTKEPLYKQKIFNWSLNIGKKYIRAKLAHKLSMSLTIKYKIANRLAFSNIREKIGPDRIKIVSGGAALLPEVCEFFLAAGFIVLEGYGLTEAAPIVSANNEQTIEIGTIGKPLFNVEVKLADDGEILVRGPNVMKGYWNDKQATEEAIDEEGWLYTGDVGIITEKGNLKITDRKKNIFVSSGGKNIAPQPIENLLCQSQFIEQCLLVGNNREYCTALITPDFGQLKVYAENLGINYKKPSELISNEKIISTIKHDIDRLQKDLAKYERVRKFSLLSEPFSMENGELTAKLNIRRHVVERKYSELIENMYELS